MSKYLDLLFIQNGRARTAELNGPKRKKMIDDEVHAAQMARDAAYDQALDDLLAQQSCGALSDREALELALWMQTIKPTNCIGALDPLSPPQHLAVYDQLSVGEPIYGRGRYVLGGRGIHSNYVFTGVMMAEPSVAAKRDAGEARAIVDLPLMTEGQISETKWGWRPETIQTDASRLGWMAVGAKGIQDMVDYTARDASIERIDKQDLRLPDELQKLRDMRTAVAGLQKAPGLTAKFETDMSALDAVIATIEQVVASRKRRKAGMHLRPRR